MALSNYYWYVHIDSFVPRLITEVAVKDIYDRVWHLPSPFRHHHVLHLMNRGSYKNIDAEQGFLDNSGKFVDREEAFKLACLNGQLKRRQGTGCYNGDELFSEDLW